MLAPAPQTTRKAGQAHFFCFFARWRSRRTGAPPRNCMLFATSEEYFQRKLHYARITRLCDITKGGICELPVGIFEFRVIKEVVKLGAEFRAEPLVDGRFLGHDQVGIAEGRTAAQSV